jgi:hypothetical protein
MTDKQGKTAPTTRPLRHILPFEAPRPRPLGHYERVIVLDGRPIRWVGQRWRDEDLPFCPHPSEPDPLEPGTSIVIRLTSLITGSSASALSPEETEALRAAWGGRPDPKFRA